MTTWRPPRPLLVMASAGATTPNGDGAALLRAIDLVERCLVDSGVLPSDTVSAIEVTLRYSDLGRPPRIVPQRKRPNLLRLVKCEPLAEMMHETPDELTHRFSNALADCVVHAARKHLLDGTAAARAVECMRKDLAPSGQPHAFASPREPMNEVVFWQIIELLGGPLPTPQELELAARELARCKPWELALFMTLLERHSADAISAAGRSGVSVTLEEALGLIALGRPAYEERLTEMAFTDLQPCPSLAGLVALALEIM